MKVLSGRGLIQRLTQVWVLSILATITVTAPLRAHEVSPAVADLTIEGDRLTMVIEMALEAPVAGLDLDGLTDTNDAARAEDYDELRALPPDQLEDRLRTAWPGIAALFTIRSDGVSVMPGIAAVDIPEVGNTELPRVSTLTVTAELPPGDAPVIMGWDASLGGLILRQQGVEDPYTAYLTSGSASDPIAREGGDDRSWAETGWRYLISGFEHIIPLGVDHILFVLGLFFFALHVRPLLWQVSAFTLAHTVTLALATLGVIDIPDEWMWLVEALIALSITYVAVENIRRAEMTWVRPTVVFCFGLLHGLGFASVLGDVGLAEGRFLLSLIAFNVGVEVGQLTVIAVAALLLVAARGAADVARLDDEEIVVRDTPVIFRSLSLTGSILIGLIGFYWFLERIGALPV